MGIGRIKDRNGSERIVVSKYWPEGAGRVRRYVPNLTIAKKLMARIEEAIAMGTWRELKEELEHGAKEILTIKKFSDRFLYEYCKPRMRTWSRYELCFKYLNRDLGTIAMADFRRADLYQYAERRAKEHSLVLPTKRIASHTVNREIAALKKMFTWAVEVGVMEAHPLVRFQLLPVQEIPKRIPTLAQVYRVIDCTQQIDLVVGAVVAMVAETAIRKQEALWMEWDQIDFKQRLLTVSGRTKNRKPRYIPLSDLAIEWCLALVRYVHTPYVFVNPRTRQRWANPEKKLRQGRRSANLPWVALHTLRHFRISQWVRQGIDIRTVKEFAGHDDISTTMGYMHLFEGHAIASVREAQAAEKLEREKLEREKLALM